MATRKQLIERIVPKLTNHKSFRLLRGYTLGQLNEVISMVLDARNEVTKELNDGRAKQDS